MNDSLKWLTRIVGVYCLIDMIMILLGINEWSKWVIFSNCIMIAIWGWSERNNYRGSSNGE